jgi:ferric-dicitrate binding protein FerR (iron transport regulator)
MSADRFLELYERYGDGALSDVERAEFLALLEDPDRRAQFARAASYEAVLSEELRLAELPAAEAARASSRSWPRVASRRIPIQSAGPAEEARVLGRIALAAAAAVLLILVLVFVTSPKGDEAPVVVRPRGEAAPLREAPAPSAAPRPPLEVAPRPKEPSPAPELTPRKFEPAAEATGTPPGRVAPRPATSPKPAQRPATRPEEPPHESASVVAILDRVLGEARVGAEPAEAGKGIAAGRPVSTGRGGYAALRFPDGSRIELGSETALSRVTDGPTGKSAFLEQGMIFVDAAKQPVGRPLSITTDQAESLVVGTQFVLQAAPSFTRIDVREGRVKFTRLPQAVSSVMVSAGHYAVAGPPGEAISKPGVGLWKAPPAGLQLWLRADAGVKLYGNGVASWTDLSPAGNSALQDKAAAQPAFVANAQAGRPALRFDGVDDALGLPDGFSDFRAGLTAFVVARPAPGRPYARFIDLDIGPACDNIVFGQKDAPDKLGFWIYNNSLTKGKVEAPGAVVAGELQSFSALLSPSGRVTLFRNGQALASGDTSTPRFTTRKPNSIGKSNSGGGDPPFKGDLFEILLYNRALSEVERVYVEAYLFAKYFDPTTPPASLRPAEK